MSSVRIVSISLLYGVMGLISSAAQQPAPVMGLADLQRIAVPLGGRMVVVRCHLSRTAIFDEGHITSFPFSWSDQIRNTPEYRELVNAAETDWLIVTGHLDRANNFIIYEGKFDKPHITIKIINAKTNQPITDEKLNVALREDQIGSAVMATDKNGLIDVSPGNAAIIRILSNMYADCRPRGELYTNYSIAQIHQDGIATDNLCSSARPKAKPGELILFEIPRTFIPSYPKPPLPSTPPVPVTPESFLAPCSNTFLSEVVCSTPS
jgi:hypothetical protein